MNALVQKQWAVKDRQKTNRSKTWLPFFLLFFLNTNNLIALNFAINNLLGIQPLLFNKASFKINIVSTLFQIIYSMYCNYNT